MDLVDADVADLLASYAAPGDPGLAAGVYRDGCLVASACVGRAVLEHDVPVTADTVFDIASASKHFTAACLVLLEREGVLDLGRDVRSYLPELSLCEPVTLRQCMSHTGGLREYYGLVDITGVPVAGMTDSRMMRLLAGQRDLNFPPGTSWSYSNTGYQLAAAVVRRLTGLSLAQFAAERIFAPLAMRVTRFRDDLAVVVPRLATGYTPTPSQDAWHRVDITEETVGDGGIVTSIRDLAAWQHFMLTGAGLGTDVRDALLPSAVLADGRRLPYALGLEITPIAGGSLYAHSGAIGGFRSALAYSIDHGVGVAVLANRDDLYPMEIAYRMACRLTDAAEPPVPIRADPDEARAAQARIVGTWFSPDLDIYLTLNAAEDGTVTQTEGTWRSRFALMSDGTWHGIEGMVSEHYRRVGSELWCADLIETSDPEIYVPVTEPPGVTAPPTCTFFSDELNTYAAFETGDAASTIATIGLAKPRRLTAMSPQSWAGEGITVHVRDGAVEVSVYGARRNRFTAVSGTAPKPMRGL